MNLLVHRGQEETTTKWMPCPKINTEFPGLAYVCVLDELIIAKQKDLLHDLVGTGSVNYTIFNKQGEKVCLALQNNSNNCKFDVKVYNYYGNEIIQVKKVFALCLKRIKVWAPPGNYVGSVEKVNCRRIYLVRNKVEKVELKIKTKSLCRHMYHICSNECYGLLGQEIGFMKFFEGNKCGLTFPMSINVRHKAVLLGACFLIGCVNF